MSKEKAVSEAVFFKYLDRPFNIKSKVIESQKDLNQIHLRPEDAKTLEKQKFIERTGAYKNLVTD